MESQLTISTQQNSVTLGGNGSTTVFSFSFVGAAAYDIYVYITDTSGNITTLSNTQYTLSLNAPAAGQIWGVGGTVTYPISGTPIASGYSITIQRTLPFTQSISISNQGNFYPQVTETGLDTLEMQIQQINGTAGRAIQLPSTDSPSINRVLPSAAARANQALLFDNSGNVIVGAPGGTNVPISAAMLPVVQASTIAAANAVLGVTPAIFGVPSGDVIGTGNAIVITATSPTDFSLQDGTLLTFSPVNNNTGSVTIQTPDNSIVPLKKLSYSGLTNLVVGDSVPGIPIIMQYNGSVWVGLNILPDEYNVTVTTSQNLGFGNLLNSYVNTAAVTYTVAQTTTLLAYWYVDIFAQGGPATIAINAADKLNKGASGVGFTMPTGTSGRLTTDAAGNFYLSGTAVTGQPTQSTFKNLQAAWASNTTATITFDAMTLKSSTNSYYNALSGSLTLNSATSGAGGLDTGSLAASTWYYIYAIYNGTLLEPLMSLSSTAPTLPSGYTFASGAISAVRTDGSKNFLGFKQYGRKWQYLVGDNLSALPSLVSGATGSVSTPTYTATSVTALVPTAIAATIKIVSTAATGGSNIIGIYAPNANYGSDTSTTNPPIANTYGSSSVFDMLLESTNIYVAQQSSNYSFVSGFELNI